LLPFSSQERILSRTDQKVKEVSGPWIELELVTSCSFD